MVPCAGYSLHPSLQGTTHSYCNLARECAERREELQRKGQPETAVVRHYTPGWMFAQHADCERAAGGGGERGPALRVQAGAEQAGACCGCRR